MQKKTTKKKRINQTNQKSKQKVKKLKTFNQSDFSLYQQTNPNAIADVFKNQAFKKKSYQNTSQINFNSTVNNYTSVYTVISNLADKTAKPKSIRNPKFAHTNNSIIDININKKKVTKSKSKSKIIYTKQRQKQKQKKKQKQKIQSYQYIPPSKNSLNSQIVFSNQDTKRQSQQGQLKNSFHINQKFKDKFDKPNKQINQNYSILKTKDQLIVTKNKLLSLNIKQQYKRKTEAAIKIQKVFRGFLTRKILQKYIKKQQQKLNDLLNEYKMSSQSQYKSHRSNEFFSEHNHTSKTFQDEESFNLSKLNPSQFKDLEQSKKGSSSRNNSNLIYKTTNQKQILNCEDQIQSSDYQQEQQNTQNQAQSQSSSDGQKDFAIYRHQEAIYSQSQIQQFLQSSSGSQNQNQQPHHLFDRNTFSQLSNHVIMQTNQEHIQSRKSSILHNQHKNKLVKGRNSLINLMGSQIQNIKQQGQKDLDLLRTSKMSHGISQNKLQQIKSEKKSKKSQMQLNQDIQHCDNSNILHSNQKTYKKQCKSTKNKLYSIKLSSEQQQTKQFKQLQQKKNQKDFKQKSQNDNKIQKQLIHTIQYKSNSIIKINNKSLNEKTESHQKKVNNMKKKKVIYYSSDQDSYSNDTILNINNKKFNSILSSPKKSSQYSNKKAQYSSRKAQSSNSKLKNSKTKKQNQQFQRFKKLQMKKWDEVIRLINQQIQRKSPQNNQKQAFNKTVNYNTYNSQNNQYEDFIKNIMKISLKNKQILSNLKKKQNQNKFVNSDIQEWKDLKDSLSLITSKRSSVSEHDIAIFRPNPNSRLIVCNKQINQRQSQHQKASFFKLPRQQLKDKINKIEQANNKYANRENCSQNDKKLKQYQDLICNFQNDHIESMLSIREQLLQKRECEQLTKLNEKLIKKQINQKQFLGSLTSLTQIFNKQKQNIDKSRQDINKGYNAAVKLIKQSLVQGKKIGYKLPLSRSSDSYKLNKNLFNLFNGFNSVIIDQLNSHNNFIVLNQHTNKFKNNNINNQYIQPSKQIYKNNIQSKHNYNLISQTPKLSSSNNNESCQRYQQIQKSFDSNNNSINSFKEFKNNFFDQLQIKNEQNSQIPDILQQIFANNSSGKDKNKLNNFSPSQFDNFDGDLSEQSSQICFSEEQLKRFRKSQPFDLQIADMNRNLMIGTQFIKMQKQTKPNEKHQLELQNDKNSVIKLHREVYQIQQEQEIVQIINNPYINKANPSVDLIAQKQIQFIVLQFCFDIMMKPLFAERFLTKKRQDMFGLKKISDQSKKQFICIVQKLLPSQNIILTKLNQNISPLPKQLLKCMRIDFSEEQYNQQNDEQYQQIGKYQMILDQQVCNNAIQIYKQKLQSQKQDRKYLQSLTQDTLQDIFNDFPFIDSKVINFLNQRTKFVTNRKQHCQSIKWQFINMELHTIFDSWNQQIIQLKANRNGFSGIGLNQLTLSMIDRNRKIQLQQVKNLLQQSRYKVMKMLSFQNDIMNQINHQIMNQTKNVSSNLSISQKFKNSAQQFSWVYKNQDYEEYLDYCQDSKWIFYSDEALSYGLQLVYLIEQELFGQLAKQLRKKFLQLKMT